MRKVEKMISKGGKDEWRRRRENVYDMRWRKRERENMAAAAAAVADPARFPADSGHRDAISRDVISRDINSCDVISCDIISCDAISRDAIPSFSTRDVIPPRISRGSTADSPRSRTPLGTPELEPAYYTHWYQHYKLFSALKQIFCFRNKSSTLKTNSLL